MCSARAVILQKRIVEKKKSAQLRFLQDNYHVSASSLFNKECCSNRPSLHRLCGSEPCRNKICFVFVLFFFLDVCPTWSVIKEHKGAVIL